MDDLFDICFANLLELIKIHEHKHCLINQFKKRLSGFMHGTDYQLASWEKSAEEKSQKLIGRMQRRGEKKAKILETVTCPSSSTSSNAVNSGKNEDKFINV